MSMVGWLAVIAVLASLFLLFLYALGTAAKRGESSITLPVPQDPIDLFEHFKAQALNAGHCLQNAIWIGNRAAFHVQERDMLPSDAFATACREMSHITPIVTQEMVDEVRESGKFDQSGAASVRADMYAVPSPEGDPDSRAPQLFPPGA